MSSTSASTTGTLPLADLLDHGSFVPRHVGPDDAQVAAVLDVVGVDSLDDLVDYGFHAPTVSFPVVGTVMVEPTESEDLAGLDRFCEAMEAIADEAGRIADGEWPADDNPLVNAPHTAMELAGEWTHPYDREVAAYPLGRPASDGSTSVARGSAKYWPPVGRIDGAHGATRTWSAPAPTWRPSEGTDPRSLATQGA